MCTGTYTAREHDEDKGYGIIFFNQHASRKNDQGGEDKTGRRSRPHLAGHVLGSGDRDENKNIFTGHVDFLQEQFMCKDHSGYTGNDRMGG